MTVGNRPVLGLGVLMAQFWVLGVPQQSRGDRPGLLTRKHPHLYPPLNNYCRFKNRRGQ